MTIRRASLIPPCRRLDDFPTHLTGDRAAELLAAWTVLWHPALIAATGTLPGWHPADEPPDPSELDGELVVVPAVSRQRLAEDWCDRLRATAPRNPPPVEAAASRDATLAAALSAAGLDPQQVAPDTIGDFLALGHAHLQVELLTRAMHYSSVLDTEQFTSATVAAAGAALAGNDEAAHDELARAFDLLADARNHVYSVDFYIIDVTLLAGTTLGEALRAKLASGSPTSLLASGELLGQMDREHPETLAELRRAIDAGTACVVGGTFHGGLSAWASPEAILGELEQGQQAARQHLGRDYEVFAQFEAAFSPLLPEVLAGMGFRAALHAAFDGGRLPRPEQCKTWWGAGDASSTSQDRERTNVQALATTPLDVARPETWLKLAERIGETIARDHVATVLLAGWPGAASEYYDDLRRAARYGPLLGKLVTLDEYFRVSREPDEWTTFSPREYPSRIAAETDRDPIDAYRLKVLEVQRRCCRGLAAAAGLELSLEADDRAACSATVNPWNFACPHYVGVDPLDFSSPTESESLLLLPDVPGCGYAMFAAAAAASPVALAEGRTLRNERLELTVSETTGGIQSLRTHRDRTTRLSQRLVFHHGVSASLRESQMVAERIEITRNDAVIGEITSGGRLLDAAGEPVARFTQRMRVARGLPAAIVDVQLDPERLPAGDVWGSYYASRLAWSDEALAFRCGIQWLARPATRPRIESPEWVEIDDGIGRVTCFALGLPYHRQAAPTWLDTLLLAAGQQPRRCQFALGIDEAYPTQTALALLTAGQRCLAKLPTTPSSPTGWFLHVAAQNVIATHVEPLAAPQAGVRLRLLETEGRDAHTSLAAFRPFRAARTTDFRGSEVEVLSVAEGRAELHIGPHRWIQIEAQYA